MERTLETGLVFDVSDLFADSPPNTPGFITLRVPDGMSPKSLRQSTIGKKRIHQDVTWYDTHDWAHWLLPSGVYHLRLPVPNSNSKTFDEQKALLLEGEQVAPLVLLELALLCLSKAGLPDPLNGDWVRCAETADGNRVVLRWFGGRLGVGSDWGGGKDGLVWLTSVRTS